LISNVTINLLVLPILAIKLRDANTLLFLAMIRVLVLLILAAQLMDANIATKFVMITTPVLMILVMLLKAVNTKIRPVMITANVLLIHVTKPKEDVFSLLSSVTIVTLVLKILVTQLPVVKILL